MFTAKIKIQHLLLFVAAFSLIILMCGCTKSPNQEKQSATPKEIKDEPLNVFQEKLLDLAIEAANKMPVNPHVKDRSKAQQHVVETCLKLDQPVRAIKYSDKIENWRLGLCYAKTAFYLASKGYTEEQLQKGLEIAEEVAKIDHRQKWRSDRIWSQIAKTYMVMGKPEKAKEIKDKLLQSESGTAETEIESNSQLSFEQHIKALSDVIDLDSFEITQNALYGYAALFNQYYDDVQKRDLIKEKIDSVWKTKKLPINIRIELLLKLAEVALDHGDNEKALELVNENHEFFNSYKWSLDKYIPMSAKIAKLRYRCGDKKKALVDIDSLLELYQQKQETLLDIYHAETICPVAEGYQLMGNSEKSLFVYKKAVEGGAVNPNIRPRAEDISATCCSMALHSLEPDAELWEKIDQTNDGLAQ